MRALRYAVLNMALVAGLFGQIPNGGSLDDKQKAEYYRLSALMTWAQLEVALQDLKVRDAVDKRRVLYEDSAKRLIDMQKFQSGILRPGCEIIPERARVLCKGDYDGEKDIPTEEATPTDK